MEETKGVGMRREKTYGGKYDALTYNTRHKDRYECENDN